MAPVSPEPNLAATLRAALNAARKAQDKERTLVLGTILANLKNREIELRRPATDDEVAEVLRKGSRSAAKRSSSTPPAAGRTSPTTRRRRSRCWRSSCLRR